MSAFLSVKTKWGTFQLFVAKKGLYAVRFPGQYPAPRPGLCRAALNFREYFKNPTQLPKLRLDLSGFTDFQKKVYRTLMRVPEGKTISYAELAQRAGYPGAARAVGTAMKKNRLPIVIPCHRVIKEDGSLGQYACGVHWKKWLLEYEQMPPLKTGSSKLKTRS